MTQSRTCPVCGNNNDLYAAYCGKCGWPVGSAINTLQVHAWAQKYWQQVIQLTSRAHSDTSKQARELVGEASDPHLTDSQAEQGKIEFDEEKSSIKNIYAKISQLESNLNNVKQTFFNDFSQLKKDVEAMKSLETSQNPYEAIEWLRQELRRLKEQQGRIHQQTSKPRLDDQAQWSGQYGGSDVQPSKVLSTEADWLSKLDKSLSEGIQRFENDRHRINDSLHEVSSILSKLQKLEALLTSAHEQIPDQVSTRFSHRSNEQDASPPELTRTELKLVDRYNTDAKGFESEARSVSETDESQSNRRLGAVDLVKFEPTQRGNYWILSSEEQEFLVPSERFRINEHNSKTITVIFSCNNYQPGYSERFTLVKPAKVTSLLGGEQWQLEESGILKF